MDGYFRQLVALVLLYTVLGAAAGSIAGFLAAIVAWVLFVFRELL